MSDDTNGGDKFDGPEIASPKHIAGLARDSGVALACAVALLYLASHMYGTEYLEIYGISGGYHQFGLANLAMIPASNYIAMGSFGFFLHTTIVSDVRALTVSGMIGTFSLVAIRPLYGLAYGVGPDGLTPAIIIGCFALAAYLGTRLTFKRRTQRLRALLTESWRATHEAMRLLNQSERTRSTADSPEVRAAAEMAGNELNRRMAERSEITRRLSRLGIFVLLSVSALTIVLAVPATAAIAAITAADSRGFAPIAPNAPIRIPVYWVGDRVVFLTSEGRHCYVHVQIANVEQSKNRCPALIAAVAPP